MRKLLALLLVVMICQPGFAFAAPADSLFGEWYSAEWVIDHATGKPAILVEHWTLGKDMGGIEWISWHDPQTKESLSSFSEGFRWSLEGGRFHHMMGRQEDEWWDAGYELSGDRLTIRNKVFHRSLVWPSADSQPTEPPSVEPQAPQPTAAPKSVYDILDEGLFRYEEDGEGGIRILGYRGSLLLDGYETSIYSSLHIPSEIDGKPVRSIANGVFNAIWGLEYVIFPEGLVSIGYRVLYLCHDIKGVWLPGSLQSIDGEFLVSDGVDPKILAPEGSYAQRQGRAGWWPVEAGQPEDLNAPAMALDILPKEGERSFFGRYSFSIRLMDDVDFSTAIRYGMKNWKEVLSAAFTGDVSGQSVADEYMRQPARAKSLLKTVLNRMQGRSIETHKDASVAIKRVKAIQRLADTLLKVDLPLEGIQEISEYIKYSNIAKDYTKDFASHYLLLDTLIRVTPRNSHIRDIAKELMEDYATASARELAKKWASGTLMLLTATAGGDSIVQGLLAGVPALDTLDTVIGLSVLKHNAYEVLEAHGDRMREDGQPDPEDEETYELLFHLCRELTLMEYEAMKTHYKWYSEEAAFLQQEIESLRKVTPDNRIPAGRFKGN